MATSVVAGLPNGFHDAELRELVVLYARQEVQLRCDFWIGDLNATIEEDREATRSGLLRLTGVMSMVIEPPAMGYPFAIDGGVDVDGGFGVYPGDPPAPDDGLVRLWFYVSTWNARMMFAAKECALEWVGSGPAA